MAAFSQWESHLALARLLRDDADVEHRILDRDRARANLRGAAWLGGAHLVVDAVCVASVLRASPPANSVLPGAVAFVIGYDLLAFAGQVPVGWLVDKLSLRRFAALLGLLLSAAALATGRASALAVLLLAGAGNALFHVGAGAMVLAGSRGRSAPAGVFVAPGALGLGIGILLGRKFAAVILWPWAFALAAAVIVVLLVGHASAINDPSQVEDARRPAGQAALIASLLCLSVMVRSLVGTVGCDGCPRGLFLLAALPLAAFAGKFAGGFLADRFGWVDLSLAALLASGPMLAWSGGDLWIALPGMVLFQMTMPVTLTAMARLVPDRPGLAFGLPCLALVLGTLPVYLPGGWRPRGWALLLLVLGSAAALYLALRLLLTTARSAAPTTTTTTSSSTTSTLCRENP